MTSPSDTPDQPKQGDSMTPSERLTEMLRYDEIHSCECASTDGPPGPFHCDCEVPELLRALLIELAATIPSSDTPT